MEIVKNKWLNVALFAVVVVVAVVVALSIVKFKPVSDQANDPESKNLKAHLDLKK